VVAVALPRTPAPVTAGPEPYLPQDQPFRNPALRRRQRGAARLSRRPRRRRQRGAARLSRRPRRRRQRGAARRSRRRRRGRRPASLCSARAGIRTALLPTPAGARRSRRPAPVTAARRSRRPAPVTGARRSRRRGSGVAARRSRAPGSGVGARRSRRRAGTGVRRSRRPGSGVEARRSRRPVTGARRSQAKAAPTRRRFSTRQTGSPHTRRTIRRAVPSCAALRNMAGPSTCRMATTCRARGRRLRRRRGAMAGTTARPLATPRRTGKARRLRVAGMGRRLPVVGTVLGLGRHVMRPTDSAISHRSPTTPTPQFQSSTGSTGVGVIGIRVFGPRCTDRPLLCAGRTGM
jgi:hypothetical protein